MTTDEQLARARQARQEWVGVLATIGRHSEALVREERVDSEARSAAVLAVGQGIAGAEAQLSELGRKATERTATQDAFKRARQQAEAQIATYAKLVETLEAVAAAEQKVAELPPHLEAARRFDTLAAQLGPAIVDLKRAGPAVDQAFLMEAMAAAGLSEALRGAGLPLPADPIRDASISEQHDVDGTGQPIVVRRVEPAKVRDAATLVGELIAQPLRRHLLARQQEAAAFADEPRSGSAVDNVEPFKAHARARVAQ